MHYFEDWKVQKYRKQRKNKLLQRLLDEIESQSVSDILSDVNATEPEIILSEDEEEDEEGAVAPVPGLDGAHVLETCIVCRQGDEAGVEMNWVSFECGHQFCDPCAEHLLALGAVCPAARCELKNKRRIYHNINYVIKASQPTKPVQRVLTQDERRQENVLLMQGRAHYQPPQQTDDISSDEEVVVLETAGKHLILCWINLKYCKQTFKAMSF